MNITKINVKSEYLIDEPNEEEKEYGELKYIQARRGSKKKFNRTLRNKKNKIAKASRKVNRQ
jgi:cell division protein FtsB